MTRPDLGRREDPASDTRAMAEADRVADGSRGPRGALVAAVALLIVVVVAYLVLR